MQISTLRGSINGGAFLAVFWLVASDGPIHASPSTTFCHPLQAEDFPGPAAKPLVDSELATGHPREVRLIYFRPSDRPYQEQTVEQLKEMVLQSQAFYAEQMEGQGYGPLTFAVERDAEGEIVVHDFESENPDDHFSNDPHSEAFREIGSVFDTSSNIYLAFIDNSRGERARGGRYSKIGGQASTVRFEWKVVAHELGHAFGLEHDFRDDAFIMSYGDDPDRLSACAARFLSVHPYFNPETSTSMELRPSVELLSPAEYPENQSRISMELQLEDPDGLHQVFVSLLSHPLGWAAGYYEIVACHELSGEDSVVEIEFDDPTPAYFLGSSKDVVVQVLGSDGDYDSKHYTFTEKSPYHYAVWRNSNYQANDVDFSPDGSLLAVSSPDGIRLWDVESLDLTRSFGSFGGTGGADFSPDGSLLATEGSKATILDLMADQSFRLEETRGARPVAFSPDGSLLAVGEQGGGLKLWDVETRTVALSLEGHTDHFINHLSFTSDGSLLASVGTRELFLWDVATGERRTAPGLPQGTSFSGVASAPHTPMLLFSAHGEVWTWYPSSEDEAKPISAGDCDSASRVAFSPSGQILAVLCSWGDTIHLVDLFTRESLAEFGVDGATSVDFAPDGRLLAAASYSGMVSMWDVSKWMGPRPGAIVKVSGDDQEGSPGSELGEPYIVRVLDHEGNPLPGANVTFQVISGGGDLDGYSAREVVTDADGLAEVVLTLGVNPGQNTLRVFVGEREVLTFLALGTGDPRVDMPDFHYPTWNLPEGATIRLGRGEVAHNDRNVVFSPSGEFLAVATAGGVWIYDVDDLRRFFVLPVRRARSVGFSHDGRTVAVSAGDEGSMSLWDVETREQTASLGDGGWFLSFSSDGSRLIYGSAIREVETGETTLLEGFSSAITSAAFSQDGTMVATGEEDGTIRLWDPETGASTAVLEGHPDIVNSVSFSHDGSILAAASGDGSVGLWDPATGDQVGALQGHEAHVLSVAFSPVSNMLASGGWNGSLIVWDAITQEKVRTFTGHSGRIWGLSFSPDERTLASAADGNSVGLWEVETGHGRLLNEHLGFFGGLSWSPDGSRIITNSGGHYGHVHLWNALTGQHLAAFSGQDRRVSALSFSPNGRTLMTGSYDKAVFWDLEDFTKIREVNAPVSSALLSPDGRMVATKWREGVSLWSSDMTEELGSLTGFSDLVTAWVFSPDSQSLVCASFLGEIKVWHLTTGEVVDWETQTDRVLLLAFSPDGGTLVSVMRESWGANGARYSRWDWPTGRAESFDYRDWNGPIALSPDGRILATGAHRRISGTWRRDIILSDFETGRILGSTEGPSDQGNDVEVLGLKFSPDGSRIATLVRGGFALVWDVDQILPYPEALVGVSGDGQEEMLGTSLQPLVIEVRDQHGQPFADAIVTFEINGPEGTPSTIRDTTDSSGRASTTLTLGAVTGTYEVVARVDGLEPVTFTAAARANPDFDGDGEVGFSDFFLFTEAFGSGNPRFDLDASGRVDFADFFLFAEHFGGSERAKLIAMAHERIGLPDGPQLRQNVPNPFNGQTVISWFQMKSGPARLEVYALTGQRVAVVSRGFRAAGMHQLPWHGLDDQGRPLASGVYVYRLATPSETYARKLTLIR